MRVAPILITISLVAMGSALGAGCSWEAPKSDSQPVAAGPFVASADDIAAGKKTFETVCVACHTIGEGDRVGPDLQGVHERRDAAWLLEWMKDPIGMGKSDPIGREMLAKYKNVPMPPTNLDDRGIAQVLAFIESASSSSAAAAPTPPETSVALDDRP